jgi:hypothetical protein
MSHPCRTKLMEEIDFEETEAIFSVMCDPSMNEL